MGAGQSSTASPESAQTEVKTSYYELLGVDRNAGDDEIKKAYRKKALELHPDRNYGNVESATKLFAEVQTAYEVLSDSQERAWYDSHENAILRGDDAGEGGQQYEYGNVKVTSADDIARMIRKFNSSVDFSDSPSGFFGYLRETFAQLAKEEEVAAQWEDVDVPDYPTFGHKGDSHNDVVKSFYAVWMSFSTRKTFSWKDQYRLSEAPDRRVRRLMEKENKRLRDEGIREFNDAVRALVAFVRKRDPRFEPNTQTEDERQKVLRDAAAAQAARARAANAAKMEQEVPDWAMKVERDEHEAEMEESDIEEEHYECVACRKTFKSEKQWDAHEKSKKHQKAIYALRKKMQKENAALGINSESVSGIDTPVSGDEADELPEAEYPLVEDDTVEKIDNLSLHEDQDSEDGVAQVEIDDVQDNQPDGDTAPTSEVGDSSDDEYASPETVKARLASTTLDAASKPDTNHSGNPDKADPADDSSDSKSATAQPKLGKAAQKRAKRAAAAAAATATSSGEQAGDDKFKCETCNAAFPSKTRMHQHIKDFGHAALKTVSAGGGGRGKKGKR
ncbi:hypothetical protein MBLNU459_g4237t1 [Dothideomycetes sp. NU459]